MTHQPLLNNWALVTGSTSGIGFGIAKVLACQGANVILTGLSPSDEGNALAVKMAEESNTSVVYVQSDLSKPDGVESLLASAHHHAGGALDILVNNAGIQFVSPVEDFPLEKWALILELNLSVPFRLIRGALPAMKERNKGRIINIASVHGHVASEGKSAYVSAKHGLIGLTKVVALETAKLNITCNAICPGWVLTDLVQKQIDAIAEKEGLSISEAEQKLLSEKQPSLQFAKPEDIGALAAFLCTPSANQITGSSQIIDGGWSSR